MKPLIIQVPSGKDNKISLTIKELQDMLDKAYEAGKSDGTSTYHYCPYRWWNNCSTTTTPSITWTTSSGDLQPDYTKIYCSSANKTNTCDYNCDCTTYTKVDSSIPTDNLKVTL